MSLPEDFRNNRVFWLFVLCLFLVCLLGIAMVAYGSTTWRGFEGPCAASFSAFWEALKHV